MASSIPGPFYALATAFCWSIAVVLFKKSGEAIDAVGLNFFKNLLGLVLFLITFALSDGAPEQSRSEDVWALFLSGAVGIGFADTLLFRCLNLLGAGRTAIVDCAYSPFIMIFSFFILNEKLALTAVFGALLIVGAVLVTVKRGSDPTLSRESAIKGTLSGVIAVASMGLAIVYVKPILDRSPVLWATMIRMAGGVAALVVLAIFRPSARRSALAALRPQRAWRYAIPGSIVGTYVCLLLWVSGFKYNQANVAAILNQTATVFTVILAAIFLGDRLSLRRGVAVGMAFLGSVLVLI